TLYGDATAAYGPESQLAGSGGTTETRVCHRRREVGWFPKSAGRGAEMHTSSKVLVLAFCLSIYCWLSGSTALRERPRNLARTIPAGASVPVYGFYSDARHPALVTVEGIGCSADITRDCWGPDGKADPPSGPQRSRTLIQVDRQGKEMLHATRSGTTPLVALPHTRCNAT